jgi:hypothetical protein
MATLRQRTPAESPLDNNSQTNSANLSTPITPVHPLTVSEQAIDKHWWQAWDPSLTLENKGSVARDHLGKCNE